MSKYKRVQKTLSKRWLDKIPKEEIEQEELIQLWSNPDLEGYQGLAAFRNLMYAQYKENQVSSRLETLKKNTPAKPAGASYSLLEYDYLYSNKHRGVMSFIMQPYLQALYHGEDISSIAIFADKYGISKSNLGRFLKSAKSEVIGFF